MAIIEGFRVQNFRALRDVSLGKLSGQTTGEPLTPFTVVIGKNGVGKSSLFDAFGFVAECLGTDVETACDMKQRGGLSVSDLLALMDLFASRYIIEKRQTSALLLMNCLLIWMTQVDRLWNPSYLSNGVRGKSTAAPTRS